MRSIDAGTPLILLGLALGCASSPRSAAEAPGTASAPAASVTAAGSPDGGDGSRGTLARTGAALDAAMRELHQKVEANAAIVDDQLRAELGKLERRYEVTKGELKELGDRAGEEGDKARQNAERAAEDLRKEIDRVRDRLRK